MTSIAKQAPAKAGANIKSLDLLASAAKEEAQQARARAQEAEQKAATKSKAFHLLKSAAKEEAQLRPIIAMS